MAAVENSNPHGPLDPARLTAFEARIGATLPADYRRFLLAHNGGRLVPCEIVLPGEAEPFASLAAAFGLHHGADSLDRVFDNVKDYIPAEVIAFAEDEGGNLLCIGIRGEHGGRVYFWDHEGAGWEDLMPLAGSFDAFVAALGTPQPGV